MTKTERKEVVAWAKSLNDKLLKDSVLCYDPEYRAIYWAEIERRGLYPDMKPLSVERSKS